MSVPLFCCVVPEELSFRTCDTKTRPGYQRKTCLTRHRVRHIKEWYGANHHAAHQVKVAKLGACSAANVVHCIQRLRSRLFKVVKLGGSSSAEWCTHVLLITACQQWYLRQRVTELTKHRDARALAG